MKIKIITFLVVLVSLFMLGCTSDEPAYVALAEPIVNTNSSEVNLTLTDGINWLGEFASAPTDNISVGDAYFNTTDGNSYIYDGVEWDLLAQAGEDGGEATVNITTNTDTSITGILKGAAGKIAQAIEGTDYNLLPSQTGQSGKYLTTNGTATSWGIPSASATWGAIVGTLSDQTDLWAYISSLVSNNHTHSNKATLDLITEAFTTTLKSTYDSLVSANHTHSNKTQLDLITADNFTDWNEAHTNQHTHSNKTVLDNTQESFTTALKTAYDWLVSNITSAWKTGVDNHTANTSNPHSVTAAQVGALSTANVSTTSTAGKVPEANGSGKLDSWISAMSTTVAGIVEAAIGSEVTTGTDATRAVTPDSLAGSDYGKRIIEVKLIDDATALTTGDGKLYLCIPAELNGYNLVGAAAFVSTVSSSGNSTYQIYNLTQTADMLTVRISIDANEFTSYSAAVQPTIDTSNDDVATGDIIRLDKDVAGTGEKGDGVILSFQLP